MEEVEERVQTLLKKTLEADINGHDSFAERAEWYYHKLPQLLALLQDLHRGYISLQKRYNRLQESNKHHVKQYGSFILSSIDHEIPVLRHSHDQQEEEISVDYSDSESSISCQVHDIQKNAMSCNLAIDEIVAEIVMKNVESEILLEKINEMERRAHESWQKIEILEKLVDVLESERVVLMDENAKLNDRIGQVMEDNQKLSAEALFFKARAGELAECVLKMNENHKLCLITRKIECLQGNVCCLKKSYYKKEKQVKNSNAKKDVATRWWAKMRGMSLFMCGIQHLRSPTI